MADLPRDSRRLVLVGAGHAHLFALEAMALGRLRPAAATLVSLSAEQAYSGMVPGLVSGRYRQSDLVFDLPALAHAAGAEFVVGRAVRLETGAREVVLEDGRRLPYDVVSVAVGSRPAGEEIPGAQAHARFVKPIHQALALVPALEELASAGGTPKVVVVGAGAAGIEIALAVRARLRRLSRGDRASVSLLEAGPRILADRSPAARAEAHEALARNGVTVGLGTRVESVLAGALRLAAGATLRWDLLVWAAGARAPDLFRASGLATDDRGYLLVDEHLQAVKQPGLFGTGDAIRLAGRRAIPKAGVFAVRQGPILAANLAVACGKAGRLRRFVPQRRFLALLDTADGQAILSYGGTSLAGRWVMALKERIDRRFVRRFRRLSARAVPAGTRPDAGP